LRNRPGFQLSNAIGSQNLWGRVTQSESGSPGEVSALRRRVIFVLVHFSGFLNNDVQLGCFCALSMLFEDAQRVARLCDRMHPFTEIGLQGSPSAGRRRAAAPGCCDTAGRHRLGRLADCLCWHDAHRRDHCVRQSGSVRWRECTGDLHPIIIVGCCLCCNTGR